MIHNIHILIDEDPPSHGSLIQMARDQILIDAHRRGEHPWGEKRRACPLCQLGR